MGGKRGLFDSGLPTVVFVAANALGGLQTAVTAAVVAGVVLVVYRLLRREPLQQALSGFLGLALAAYIAKRTGKGSGFFLPGVAFSAMYGIIFLVSVLVRRPLVGVIAAALEGRGPEWRDEPRLRRAYTVATLGWVAVFTVRAVVVGGLILGDAGVSALGAAKLGLGWPVTIAAVALTLAYLRRVGRTNAVPPAEGSAS